MTVTDRICVVQEAIPACLNMVADTASLNLDFQCSAGRDRYLIQ